MIISASRRTDIPAFYSEWFYKRIQEGYALVRNPMNPVHVSKISLKREVVDCIIFWTKNPEGMLPKLDLIKEYPYYFQFTLNPYDVGFETDVPSKTRVIDTFKKLSDKISPQRVIWRYDPILLSHEINVNYHLKYFGLLACKLQGYTAKCIISFIDYYKKIDRVYKEQEILEIDDGNKKLIAGRFSEIAKTNGIKIETCSEDIDLLELGIGHARCIDPVLIEKITGIKMDFVKDKNQRIACGCVESIDIGTYNTCTHGCLYCYANSSIESVKRNAAKYDVNSPLLCSELTDTDKVVDREVRSCENKQISIFE